MTPQTHPRSPDTPIARVQSQQVVYRQLGILVVGAQFLGHFPLVAVLRVFGVVFERLGAGELMVARRRRADVALAGDLSGESRYGTGYC